MLPDLMSVFFIGLVGSGHCLGMCGGISSALSLSSRDQSGVMTTRTLLIPILYNIARLISYMLLGALVGGFSATIADMASFNQSFVVLRIFAALLMIALGLYLGRWWFGLMVIERAGQVLWRTIAPLANRLLPLKSVWYALPLGFLWGWLPCGLVYSMLTWSAASGSAFAGAMTMAAFGLGTLPAMLLIGLGSTLNFPLFVDARVKKMLGIVVIVYGIYTLYGSVSILAQFV
jgi:sulfite exporter TauE/SafE